MGAEGTEGSIIFLAHREWQQVDRQGPGEELAMMTTTHYALTPVEVRSHSRSPGGASSA